MCQISSRSPADTTTSKGGLSKFAFIVTDLLRSNSLSSPVLSCWIDLSPSRERECAVTFEITPPFQIDSVWSAGRLFLNFHLEGD